MSRDSQRISAFLRSRQRAIASIAVTVLTANALVVVSRALEPSHDTDPSFVAAPDTLLPEGVVRSPDGTLRLPDGTIVRVRKDGTLVPVPRGSTPTKPILGSRGPSTNPRALVQGVTDTTIEVVYYWKGERTQTSGFIKGTAVEGANLDEELAFDAYVEYINKHAGGTAQFMGIPINLHGRKLVTRVLAPNDAASGDAAYAPIAEEIAKEIKPFAAVASHGSISSYICPYLAEHGIFNMQTYDLGGLHPATGKPATLAERTNGYCTPSGIAWERQVDLTIAYLKQHRESKYGRQGVPQDRVYGIVYSTYPGLKDIGEAMVQRFKDEGIPVAAQARIPESLVNGQTEAQDVILKMRRAGVNTLIMPDAGAPLTITHAAQAQEYRPDYIVWPCSGTDTAGMVRLFSSTQWTGAEGLTCYDETFNPDAINQPESRQTQWWKAYQEVRPGKTPPAPAPLVYAGLFQLVAGISQAGRNLTPATFNASLDALARYRYDSIDGVTTDPTNMLITMAARDRSMIGDVGYLRWNGTTQNGEYVYPEDRRYRTEADF